MQKGIIGKKIGMTQIFDEAGKVIPVTVVEAGPCVVVQKKTVENDGYEAVQLGYVGNINATGNIVAEIPQILIELDPSYMITKDIKLWTTSVLPPTAARCWR